MTGGEAPGRRCGGGDVPSPRWPACGTYILLNGLAIRDALDTGGGVMWGDCCRSIEWRSRSALLPPVAFVNDEADEW